VAIASRRFMCLAQKLFDSCGNNRAVANKRRTPFLLWVMVLGILVLTSTIGRTQNLLTNGALATSASPHTVLTFGASSSTIANWTTTLSTNSGASNYSLNGTQSPITNPAIPSPPPGATYSVQLDSTASGPNNGSNNTLTYNSSVALLAHTQYDLSFYLNSETGGSSVASGNATGSLNLNATNASGLGLTIARVTMANAGAVSGSLVASGFGNTVSGTTVSLTAPTLVSTSTTSTQPWVKVDIIFTTTNAVTLPANSILFTDLGNSSSNNSSVANFSLAQVVPEISDWRITAGICVFCIAFGSVAKRRGAGRRLILKSGGRSKLRINAGPINPHKAA
jgi:hypothetical protein